jgi:hypothetical protein
VGGKGEGVQQVVLELFVTGEGVQQRPRRFMYVCIDARVGGSGSDRG